MAKMMTGQISGFEINEVLHKVVEDNMDKEPEDITKIIRERCDESMSQNKNEKKFWKKVKMAVHVIDALQKKGVPQEDVKYIQNAIFWNDGTLDIQWDRTLVQKEIEKRRAEQIRNKLIAFGMIGSIFREFAGFNEKES